MFGELQSLECTCAVLLFCSVRRIVPFDVTVFSDRSLLLPGHVWYVREGHDFAANCTPVWSVKYQEARFMWKDHLGRGAARRDWRVYGNGTLWMHDVKTTDTDTYHCSVYLPGSYERYLHSVIVYSIANFYMEYPLFYKVLKCDYQLNSLKIQEIQEFVCQHYQTKCPFHTIFNCRRLSSLAAGADRIFQLIVVLQQYPDIDFEPPECEIACIKQSVVRHLNNLGESVVNKLIASENASQLQIYGVLEFDAKQLNGKRIQTQCPAGYELYEDIICVPCFPDYYLDYGVGNSAVRRPCKQCPMDFYQDKFGMDNCFKCLGISRLKRPFNETFTMELCDVSILRLPPVYMYIVAVSTCAVVIVIVVGICVTCWSRRGKVRRLRMMHM